MKILFCFGMAAVISLVIGLASTSYAGNVAVTNADFETGGNGTSFVGGAPSGWTVTNSGVASFATGVQDVGIDNFGTATTSVNGMLQISNSDGTGASYLAQDLGAVVTGQEYTATVEIGYRQCCGGALWPDDYSFELLVDGVVFASDSLANASGTIPGNEMLLLTAVGTSGSAGTLSIRLHHAVNVDTANHQGWFDNVDVNVVPEPTAFALAAICLVGVGAYRRRRR